MSSIHLGYFAEPDSNSSLLIDADPDGLRELGQMFDSLASGRIKRVVLHKLPLVQVHHAVELRALSGDRDRGARRDGSDNSFTWERSKAGWRAAAQQLATLAEAAHAGHYPFEAEADELVVVVSKGEYGDAWWAAHG